MCGNECRNHWVVWSVQERRRKSLSAFLIVESASSPSVGGESGLFHTQTLMYNPHPSQVTQNLCSVIPFTLLAITPGIRMSGQVLYGPCVKLLGRLYELQGWMQPKSYKSCKLGWDKQWGTVGLLYPSEALLCSGTAIYECCCAD